MLSPLALPLEDGQVGVPHYQRRVCAQLRAESGAGRAGAEGAVEREHPRRQLLYGDAAVLAGVVLGEELLLARGHIVDQHQPAREASRRLGAVREAAGAVRPDHQAVDHDLYVVLLVLVEGYLLAQVVDRAVDAHSDIAALARVLEHLGVLALAGADNGCEYLYAAALRPGHDLVDNLVYGLLADLLAALGAVRDADARPEQAEVVVDLRNGANGGARVAAGGLLVYADGRGQTLDVVHVGLVHLAEEHTRIARKALDIAALALCVYGVERERAFARAGEPGEHDQLVARYLQVDVLEVVLPRALDVYAVSHVCRSYLLHISQSGNYTPAEMEIQLYLAVRSSASKLADAKTPPLWRGAVSLSKKPRRVSRPMGAKGTAIIFGGGVYVAENTFRGAQCRIVRLWRTTEARSAAPVPIGRSRPGDFIVKKGRRGPFLTVSPPLWRGAVFCVLGITRRTGAL